MSRKLFLNPFLFLGKGGSQPNTQV